NFFALNLDPDAISFWSGNDHTGNVYRFNIATGAVLQSLSTPFDPRGGPTGLTVFGERTAAGRNIDLVASNPSVGVRNLTGCGQGAPPGGPATFTAQFTGDGAAHSFDLQFVAAGTSVILGSLPVTVNEGYLYQVRALDPDGEPITYRLDTAPPGASLDAQ